MRPTVYILCGVPASGKTTWIANQSFNWDSTVVASTDLYIEEQCRILGKPYRELFHDMILPAVSHMVEVVNAAFRDNLDIVWDQTSCTVESRRKKLRMIPASYSTVAVVFPTPPTDEHANRLANRGGKVIPASVVSEMVSAFVMPTLSEGFDQIVIESVK